MFKTAIIGASGYTGAELVRLLCNHNYFSINYLSAERKYDTNISDIYPHLECFKFPNFVKFNDLDFKDLDLIFCCLPHSHGQSFIKKIPKNIKIIDLSADFRFSNVEDYQKWYGKEHLAKDLQKEAVYGLTEIYRKEIIESRLIAGTGCNAACGLYPLIPLLMGNTISQKDIKIYLSTGVSGAGRSPKQEILHSEVSEGFSAYNVNNHRHLAEFDQELSKAAGKKVNVSFIPHIIPQNRGILATICVKGKAEKVYETINKFYLNEKFIKVLPYGKFPSTRSVRGSNFCFIGVCEDRLKDNTIIISSLDNLIKGSSGQAIQNANLMFNIKEDEGLNSLPIFP